MIAKAIARYIRISPRKVRYVIDLIRGESVGEAEAILANLNKRAVRPISKVLKSAVANAKNNETEGQLYIAKITADGGPILHRYKAAAMGRAVPFKHRTTHITVELDKK